MARLLSSRFPPCSKALKAGAKKPLSYECFGKSIALFALKRPVAAELDGDDVGKSGSRHKILAKYRGVNGVGP